MSDIEPTPSMLVRSVEEVPRISDAERAELLASLKASRAEIAAGNFDVLKHGTLRKEFEAILCDDLSDAELNTLLGIV
jgi:hypothetical protein